MLLPPLTTRTSSGCRNTAPARLTGDSRSLSKPVFSPRIGRVRVTAHFPEAKDIAVQKDDFANELRALPRVTLRDDHPGRAAVFLWQGFSVPFVSDQHVVVQADLERIVGRVTVVALEENVRRFRLRFDQVRDG